MTEHTDPTLTDDELDVGTPVSTDDRDWFSGWLEAGTVSQRSLDIYGQPDLYAEYENLDRQYQIAREKEKKGAERDLTETANTTRILEKMEDLYKRWMRSKTTWYIRALSQDEIDAIRDECNFPTEPEFKKGTAEDAKRKVEDKYKRDLSKAQSQANFLYVSKALVKVTNPAGDIVKESITPQEVEKLREKVGDLQILRLVGAAMVASSEEPTMPVPLSPESSNSDHDS